MFHSIMLKKLGMLVLTVIFILQPVLAWGKTSNDPYAYQLAYEQAGVYRAWDYGVGSNKVVVAIIDNGFDTFHPDLFPNIWRNSKEVEDNGIDDDNNGYIDDIYGWNFLDNTNDPRPVVTDLSEYEKGEGVFSHASIVAGIIGAVGNNGRDGAGLNWQVKLMNLKVLGNNGSGRLYPLGHAVRYAVDNGADVINISMVGDYDSDLDEALQYAYKNGVAVVAAMGNYNGNLNLDPLYPVCNDNGAITPRILGVSATNPERKLAQFSNSGSNCVDITAPGVNIGSTVRYSPQDGLATSYEAGWQGTSFAAPFVAGAAALIKSKRIDWKAPQIYDALLKTVHHTPAIDEQAYAQAYGKGMLQVHRALAYADGLALPPTMFETTAYIPPVLPTDAPVITAPHAKTFVAISVAGKMRDAYNDSFELGGAYERPEAMNIESAAVYGTGAEQKIVTVSVGEKNNRIVSVYNNKWQLQTSWNSGIVVPVNVAVGMRTSDTIIALAPSGKNSLLYKLFDENGSQLQIVNAAQTHQGARVAIFAGKVHTVFTSNNQTMFRVDTEMGVSEKEFIVTGLGANPYVAIGDVTADKVTDFVVGSGPGMGDMVRVYNQEGIEQRSFSPFGDGRTSGVQVVIVDANNDGSKDLLTYSANTSGSIRAWTPKAKSAGEWDAPFTGSFFLLPR